MHWLLYSIQFIDNCCTEDVESRVHDPMSVNILHCSLRPSLPQTLPFPMCCCCYVAFNALTLHSNSLISSTLLHFVIVPPSILLITSRIDQSASRPIFRPSFLPSHSLPPSLSCQASSSLAPQSWGTCSGNRGPAHSVNSRLTLYCI